MSVNKEFNDMKAEVLATLETSYRARNDDKYLLYLIWSKRTDLNIPFDEFATLPMPETVRRVRQKIQNEDKMFLPTDEKVLIKRRQRRYDVRDWTQI